MQGTEQRLFYKSPFPVTLWNIMPNSHIKIIPFCMASFEKLNEFHWGLDTK